jgi:hypothetical protein
MERTRLHSVSGHRTSQEEVYLSVGQSWVLLNHRLILDLKPRIFAQATRTDQRIIDGSSFWPWP